MLIGHFKNQHTNKKKTTMNNLFYIVKKTNLKSVVVLLALCGSLGLAFIDKDQREAFMTIAITATGGFFGAEVPGFVKRSAKPEDE